MPFRRDAIKLLSFDAGWGPRLGALRPDGTILDLTDGAPTDSAMRTMQALIEAGPPALARVSQLLLRATGGLDPASVRWLAPLPVPMQIRDFVAFEEHMRMAAWNGTKLRQRWGGPRASDTPMPIPPIWYEQPLYYKGNRFAVCGPDSTVTWPTYSSVIDYELEIACVIGRMGKDIDTVDALSHVFGYTIFNDLTARDAQFREMQGPMGPAKGKDFDMANVIGPVIVTADSIDIDSVTMRAYVNSELRCDANSSSMHWKFGEMIAHASQCETLHPGEMLASGTVGGGCGLETGRFLKHGDRVELSVEGIGTLATVINATHVVEEVRI